MAIERGKGASDREDVEINGIQPDAAAIGPGAKHSQSEVAVEPQRNSPMTTVRALTVKPGLVPTRIVLT